MAFATVSGTGAPKAQTPIGKVSAAAETQPRSVLDNLILTNKAMLGQIKKDVVGAASNPLGALSNMIKGFVFPFLHPVKAVESWIDAIRQDPLDGSFNTAATVSAMAWIGSVVVAATAVAVAPLTGGASLGVAAAAFAIGDAFALGCIAADAGAIVLHEVRGARAKSSGEAIAEGVALAAYVEDEILNVVAWKAVGAAETRLARAVQARAGKLGGRAFAEGLSFAGIYDLPTIAKAVGGSAQKAVRH